LDVQSSSQRPSGWDEIVRACPWASFYHSSTNLDLIARAAPSKFFYFWIEEKGKLIAALAAGIREGEFGPVINCLPFFGSYGEALLAESGRPEHSALLYSKLKEYARAIQAVCLTVISSPFANPEHQTSLKEIVDSDFVDERLCQMTSLPQASRKNEEDYRAVILAAIDKKARNAYRKAAQQGFKMRRLESFEELLEFESIHKENIGSKSGKYKPHEFFRFVWEFGRQAPGTVDITGLFDGAKLIAGVILFQFGKHVEYHTLCLHPDYRSVSPLNLLIAEKMVEYGLKGFSLWNFGGTWKSQEGLYHFKSSFSALDYPYFYHTKFFKGLDQIKALSPEEIERAYPFFYVIPFSQLSNASSANPSLTPLDSSSGH
jgi:lipid II:glycine glycyltransferase (peptidoglycan interpeptide bridge formation enzyme)